MKSRESPASPAHAVEAVDLNTRKYFEITCVITVSNFGATLGKCIVETLSAPHKVATRVYVQLSRDIVDKAQLLQGLLCAT